MKKVALHNLGCKVNSYEIEVMQQLLQEYTEIRIKLEKVLQEEEKSIYQL